MYFCLSFLSPRWDQKRVWCQILLWDFCLQENRFWRVWISFCALETNRKWNEPPRLVSQESVFKIETFGGVWKKPSCLCLHIFHIALLALHPHLHHLLVLLHLLSPAITLTITPHLLGDPKYCAYHWLLLAGWHITPCPSLQSNLWDAESKWNNLAVELDLNQNARSDPLQVSPSPVSLI